MRGTGMENIIKILMHRDKISHEEAVRQINAFLEEAEDLIQAGDTEEIEDLLMDYLGLEPDYLFDLLPIVF